MMTVEEYAKDINQKVANIISKATELGIPIKEASDELNEDAIIMLDSAFESSSEVEVDAETVDEIIEEQNITIDESETGIKKITNRRDLVKAKQEQLRLGSKKKEMYKNKEKLIANVPNKTEEGIIFYGEGLTVKKLAEKLSVPVSEIVKKIQIYNNNIIVV